MTGGNMLRSAARSNAWQACFGRISARVGGPLAGDSERPPLGLFAARGYCRRFSWAITSASVVVRRMVSICLRASFQKAWTGQARSIAAGGQPQQAPVEPLARLDRLADLQQRDGLRRPGQQHAAAFSPQTLAPASPPRGQACVWRGRDRAPVPVTRCCGGWLARRRARPGETWPESRIQWSWRGSASMQTIVRTFGGRSNHSGSMALGPVARTPAAEPVYITVPCVADGRFMGLPSCLNVGGSPSWELVRLWAG